MSSLISAVFGMYPSDLSCYYYCN